MSQDTEPTSQRLLSPAVASGIAGGLLVGLTAAVIAFVFIGPQSDYGFDFVDTLFIALIGGVFGVIAGAVAGSSDDDHEPAVPAIKSVKMDRAREPSMTPAHRGV
jgi:hypothetical protein